MRNSYSTIDQAAGGRDNAPLLVSRSGCRLDRHGATRIVCRLAKRARFTKHNSPHSLRDVQIAARHADPRTTTRTTTRYDCARNNLERHASYIVTAFIAGAA